VKIGDADFLGRFRDKNVWIKRSDRDAVFIKRGRRAGAKRLSLFVQGPAERHRIGFCHRGNASRASLRPGRAGAATSLRVCAVAGTSSANFVHFINDPRSGDVTLSYTTKADAWRVRNRRLYSANADLYFLG